MAWEYYAFISVSPETPPEELKRAIARKRRELTAEHDEEGLKYLNEVSETFRDPEAKDDYDDFQRHGDEITVLLEEVEVAREQEHWEEGIHLLKRLLLLTPRRHALWNQLGVCYLRSGQCLESIKIYNRLTKAFPQVAEYWLNFGYSLMELVELAGERRGVGEVMSRCPQCGYATISARTQQLIDINCPRCRMEYRHYTDDRTLYTNRARECFQHCMELEPYNVEPVQQVARTFIPEKHFPEALKWAEQALELRSQRDFGDFDTLFLISTIHIEGGHPELAYATVERLLPLIVEDEDRRHANGHYRGVGIDLFKRRLLQEAGIFLKCALIIDPTDQEAQKYLAKCEDLYGADDEFENSKNDFQLFEPLRKLNAILLAGAYGQTMENQEEIQETLIKQIYSYPSARITAAIAQLKSKYPNTYALNPRLFDQLETEAPQLARGGRTKPEILSSDEEEMAALADGGVATAVEEDIDPETDMRISMCRKCGAVTVKSILNRHDGMCVNCSDLEKNAGSGKKGKKAPKPKPAANGKNGKTAKAEKPKPEKADKGGKKAGCAIPGVGILLGLTVSVGYLGHLVINLLR